MGLTTVTINANSSPEFQSQKYTGYIQNLSIGTATGQIISENNTIKNYTLPFGQYFSFSNLIIQRINNGPVPVEFTYGSNGAVPNAPSTGGMNVNNTLNIQGTVSGTVNVGNTVNILGTISGSVNIGNTVNIQGTISGSVNVGNTVNILGTVSGSVSVSNTLNIQGTISGSVTVSNNVNIEGIINTVNININGQGLGLSTYNNNIAGYAYLGTPSADIAGVINAYSITLNTGPQGGKLLKCNIAAQTTSIVNILQYIGITGDSSYLENWTDPYYRTSYETFYLAEGQSILYDLNGIQFMVMNPNATTTTTLNNADLGISQYTYTTPIYLPPNTSVTITFGQIANFNTSAALSANITVYYEGDITFSGQTSGGGGGTIH